MGQFIDYYPIAIIFFSLTQKPHKGANNILYYGDHNRERERVNERNRKRFLACSG